MHFFTYECDTCGHRTRGEEPFIRHLRITHNVNINVNGGSNAVRTRGPYRCCLCINLSFASVALLDQHLLLAHGAEPLLLATKANPLLVPISHDGGSSQQGLQPPAISVQELGSRTVTTITFPNGVQVRWSSSGDSDQSFTRVDLPGQNVRADPARKDCPVCLDEYDVSEHVFYPCGHSACRACFRNWESARTRNRSQCPLCREPY